MYSIASIVMYEYSDSSCQTKLPTFKSYSNGQVLRDAEGNCIQTIQCNNNPAISSAFPIAQYAAILGETEQCDNTLYFEALINNVCIPTSNVTSMQMEYPYLSYYDVPDCNKDNVTEITKIDEKDCHPTTTASAAEMLYLASSSVSNSYQVTTPFAQAMDKHVLSFTRHEQVKTSFRKTSEKSSRRNLQVIVDDDANWPYKPYTKSQLVNGPLPSPTAPPAPFPFPSLLDDDSTLSGGAVAGIVIGSLCGCFCFIIGCFFLCFRGLCGNKEVNTNGNGQTDNPYYLNGTVMQGQPVIFVQNPQMEMNNSFSNPK
jgi:hypothetical protein